MNWDAVGALAEILGAVGVIASLGYLAGQVRQNTMAMRGTTHEVAVEHLTAVILALSSDSDLAAIISRGSRDFASLSYEERLQFGSYWQAALIGAEGSLLQYKRGNLDEFVWQRDLSVLRPWLTTSGVREWWMRNPVAFTPEFSAVIQREIDQGPTADETAA
jgi:hypothetical protein